jgi:sigma-B regulation protein RsbU (phosphoserine phosphatase)
MGIRVKYSLWLAAILLLASGSITTAALWYQKKALTEQAILRGESIAVNLASPAADAILGHKDLLLVSLALNTTHNEANLVYAALLDLKGRVVGHPDRKALFKPLDFKLARKLDGFGDQAEVSEGSAAGQKVWDIAVPIRFKLKGTEHLLGSAHVGMARAAVADSVRRSLRGLAFISLLLLALGIAAASLSVPVVVRPLQELSRASVAVGSGNFDVRVPVRSRDELGTLAANFNEMASGLKAAEEAKAQHQRIETELALARSIQASLLPEKPPKIEGWEVAFQCLPARELGGDFYDCFEIDGGRLWGFLIADVSGKGVPAALHMANLRNAFRFASEQSKSPAEAVKKVNALAQADLKNGAFVTVVYAMIDPKKLEVRLVNAGHEPAFLVSGGAALKAFESTAMPLGLAQPMDYDDDVSETSFKMNRGDLFFTYTDGVTEAMNRNGETFGLERLKQSLKAGSSAGECVSRLGQELKAYGEGDDQWDDITMLALRALA